MIPLNKPYINSLVLESVSKACDNGMLRGNGEFTKECENWLEVYTRAKKALLTHSCTAALEVGVLAAGIETGDEVIMPSFTFVSTANAVVRAGGIPVWCDITTDTYNMDIIHLWKLVTPKTKMIIPVHYAGLGCKMDIIMTVAEAHKLVVLEDAAQCIDSWYNGRHLGTIGHMGTISFHDTKNVTCGEGGVLLINDQKYAKLAEVVREYGTDRAAFFRGDSDWYTWRYEGTDSLPSELTAAFLLAQLQDLPNITEDRKSTWITYMEGLGELEDEGYLSRPEVGGNAHIFPILVRDKQKEIVQSLRAKGVQAAPHYRPLHQSSYGAKYTTAPLPNTEYVADHLIRLPIWADMSVDKIDLVINAVIDTCKEIL